jgi:hypothetical protein
MHVQLIEEVDPLIGRMCCRRRVFRRLAALDPAGLGEDLSRLPYYGRAGVESTSNSLPQNLIAVELLAVEKDKEEHVDVVAVADLACLFGVTDRLPYRIILVSVPAGVEGTRP